MVLFKWQPEIFKRRERIPNCKAGNYSALKPVLTKKPGLYLVRKFGIIMGLAHFSKNHMTFSPLNIKG